MAAARRRRSARLCASARWTRRRRVSRSARAGALTVHAPAAYDREPPLARGLSSHWCSRRPRAPARDEPAGPRPLALSVPRLGAAQTSHQVPHSGPDLGDQLAQPLRADTQLQGPLLNLIRIGQADPFGLVVSHRLTRCSLALLVMRARGVAQSERRVKSVKAVTRTPTRERTKPACSAKRRHRFTVSGWSSGRSKGRASTRPGLQMTKAAGASEERLRPPRRTGIGRFQRLPPPRTRHLRSSAWLGLACGAWPRVRRLAPIDPSTRLGRAAVRHHGSYLAPTAFRKLGCALQHCNRQGLQPAGSVVGCSWRILLPHSRRRRARAPRVSGRKEAGANSAAPPNASLAPARNTNVAPGDDDLGATADADFSPHRTSFATLLQSTKSRRAGPPSPYRSTAPIAGRRWPPPR
jgi:hypothetical protein